MTNCINCGSGLQNARVSLRGTVKGESFEVEMDGLVCPQCSYSTIEGKDMAEYGRLLADKYRKAHGLLTSTEIRQRREALGLSQQTFADFLKRGVASVKRWEMGKIQDPDNDRHIREKTDRAQEATFGNMVDIVYANTSIVGTTIRIGNLGLGSGTVPIGARWDANCIVCGSRTTTASTEMFSWVSHRSTIPITRIEGVANA